MIKECDSQLKSKVQAPIPKDCSKDTCRHLIENGLHFNRSDLLKGYGGTCPECNVKPKSERKNSKIPLIEYSHMLELCIPNALTAVDDKIPL